MCSNALALAEYQSNILKISVGLIMRPYPTAASRNVRKSPVAKPQVLLVVGIKAESAEQSKIAGGQFYRALPNGLLRLGISGDAQVIGLSPQPAPLTANKPRRTRQSLGRV